MYDRISVMRKLKGNLHTHSIYSDGEKSIEELVVIYQNKGYDFIAITDHDFMVNEEYFKKLPVITDDFIVFRGLELTEGLINGQHIGVIYGDKETLYVLNHPSLYNLTIEDVLLEIEILKAKYTVDCIDVSHYGTYSSLYDTDLIPLPKIASDDAHRSGMFGQAWIEVETEMNQDDILRSIKRGNFTKKFKDQ